MDYNQLKETLSEITELINQFQTKKKLFLIFLKSNDSQLKKIYSKNFAVKIVTNSKIDSENYNRKLSKISGMIEKYKDIQGEIADKNLARKLTKLKNMFERLLNFMDEYKKIIEASKKRKLKKNAAEFQLKKLEQNEVSTALKDANSLFLALKNEQDIYKIFSLASKRNHSETNRVIPTLGAMFRVLFTNSITSYKLITPFNTVDIQVKLLHNNYGVEFMIYCDGRGWTYNDMVSKLDSLFLENEKNDVINSIINPILMYIKGNKSIEHEVIKKYQEEALSIDITQNRKNQIINEILAMFTHTPASISSLKISAPNSKNDVVSAAASLSGILVLAEACQYRNPTFGKIERNAIKSVLTLAKNGCLNPFAKVFSNEKGWYLPARDGGNMDTQLLLSYNFDNDSIKARFLPLPRMSIAPDKVRELLKSLIIQENFLSNFYKDIHPYNWTDFFSELQKGNIDVQTVEEVFKKLNIFFPNGEFGSAEEFIKMSIKNKENLVKKIKEYKGKDKKEKMKINDFINFIENKAYPLNHDERMILIINKSKNIENLITQAISEGYKQFLTVKIFKLCTSKGDTYFSLNALPELAPKYLEPPADKSGLNLKEYMRNKIDKGLRKFYKSQNQVLTKEQIQNLISQLK